MNYKYFRSAFCIMLKTVTNVYVQSKLYAIPVHTYRQTAALMIAGNKFSTTKLTWIHFASETICSKMLFPFKFRYCVKYSLFTFTQVVP